MTLANYRKLVACLAGLATLFLKDHTGIDLTGHEDVIATLAIDALTGVSVWYVSNGTHGA